MKYQVGNDANNKCRNGAMLLFDVTEGIQHVANSSSSINIASAHTREKQKMVGN